MRFRGHLYRALNPVWQRMPYSGEGARRHGGRFNAAGTPALYTSLDPATAFLEANQAGRPPQPTTLVAYEADLSPVLDGTDPEALSAFGFAPQDLARDDWREYLRRREFPPSQVLAGLLVDSGYTGLLVPSYAPGASPGSRNLVLFRWSRSRPDLLRLIDDEHCLGIPS